MQIHVDDYMSGDWIKVYVDGRLRHSQHALGHLDWLALLAEAGAQVTIADNQTDDDGEVIKTYPLRRLGISQA